MLLSIFAYRTVILLVNDHIAFSTFLIYVFAELIHNVVCRVVYVLFCFVLYCLSCLHIHFVPSKSNMGLLELNKVTYLLA